LLVELCNTADRVRSSDAADAGREEKVLPTGEPQIEGTLL
jgi:hypothetical protein